MKQSYWIISAVVTLVGIGIMGAGHHQYVKAQENTAPLTESYSDIHNIDLDIGSAEVNLFTDNNAKNVTVTIVHPTDSVQVNGENGTLQILEKSKGLTFFEIFGSYPMQINVTVPENIALENFDFDLGSGKGTVNGISVNQCSADLGSGSIAFDNMKTVNGFTLECASGKVELSSLMVDSLDLGIASGSVALHDVNIAKNLDLGISSGSIKSSDLMIGEHTELDIASGSMTFDNVTFGTQTDISISSGNAIFNLTGAESDYSFNCKTSSGKTSIGQNSGKDLIQSGGDKKIISNCNSGSVRFNFSE